MAGSEVLRLGPVNLPVWLLAMIGGYGLLLIVERVAFRRFQGVWRPVNDAALTAVVLFVLTWKLSPLITRFEEIAANPRVLLFAPGGTVGVVLGSLAAAAGVVVPLLRQRRTLEPGDRRYLPHFVGAVVIALMVPVALVSLVPAGSGRSELPRLVVPGLDGDEIELRADGRPMVVVFWATWCGPCSGEMPELQRLHEDDENVRIVAINLTQTESGVSTVRDYIESGGFTFPVALDPTGSAYRMFEIEGTPTTIVYDPDGSSVARKVGAVSHDWLRRRLLPFAR